MHFSRKVGFTWTMFLSSIDPPKHTHFPLLYCCATQVLLSNQCCGHSLQTCKKEITKKLGKSMRKIILVVEIKPVVGGIYTLMPSIEIMVNKVWQVQYFYDLLWYDLRIFCGHFQMDKFLLAEFFLLTFCKTYSLEIWYSNKKYMLW